jgi:hypothetical protein
MRKAAGILMGLLLMSGFFAGLAMVVRSGDPLWMLAGIGLMVVTPPLHHWLYPAIARGEKLETGKLGTLFSDTTPVVAPIALFIFILSASMIVGAWFGHWGFLAFLAMMLPAVNVLADAFHGERDWNIQDLSMAWAKLTAFIFGKFLVIAGTAVFSVGVFLFGGVTLLVTVGELAWRWFHGRFVYQPFFCDYYGVEGGACVASLAGWHLGTLFMFWLMVFHGDAMLDRAALILDRLRS